MYRNKLIIPLIIGLIIATIVIFLIVNKKDYSTDVYNESYKAFQIIEMAYLDDRRKLTDSEEKKINHFLEFSKKWRMKHVAYDGTVKDRNPEDLELLLAVQWIANLYHYVSYEDHRYEQGNLSSFDEKYKEAKRLLD